VEYDVLLYNKSNESHDRLIDFLMLLYLYLQYKEIAIHNKKSLNVAKIL
jgi:hypothetical protein